MVVKIIFKVLKIKIGGEGVGPLGSEIRDQ
jgi:hypothetical protein